jgi:hypothetical protein
MKTIHPMGNHRMFVFRCLYFVCYTSLRSLRIILSLMVSLLVVLKWTLTMYMGFPIRFTKSGCLTSGAEISASIVRSCARAPFI